MVTRELTLTKEQNKNYLVIHNRRQTMTNAFYPFAMTLFSIGCVAAISALLTLIRE
jgi:hypothetical protein